MPEVRSSSLRPASSSRAPHEGSGGATIHGLSQRRMVVGGRSPSSSSERRCRSRRGGGATATTAASSQLSAEVPRNDPLAPPPAFGFAVPRPRLPGSVTPRRPPRGRRSRGRSSFGPRRRRVRPSSLGSASRAGADGERRPRDGQAPAAAGLWVPVRAGERGGVGSAGVSRRLRVRGHAARGGHARAHGEAPARGSGRLPRAGRHREAGSADADGLVLRPEPPHPLPESVLRAGRVRHERAVVADRLAGRRLRRHPRDGSARPHPGPCSHGCIRLRNADIVALARLMPVGTPIEVR